MADIRILLAGESWVTTSQHVKGWDYFTNSGYEVGTEFLEPELNVDGFDYKHLPGHLCGSDFPLTMDELNAYDVVIISDVGANTLLLHPDTFLRGKPMPNRLRLLKEWTENGGGLAMCGGYLSFAGINAAAKYFRTPVEEVLPVTMHTFDDRVEVPEGAVASVTQPNHPIMDGITGDFPPLLGYNEVMLKDGADLVARISDHPLIATMTVGKGRSMIWSSDIGPHWCPPVFLEWDGYGKIWRGAVEWLAGKR